MKIEIGDKNTIKDSVIGNNNNNNNEQSKKKGNKLVKIIAEIIIGVIIAGIVFWLGWN